MALPLFSAYFYCCFSRRWSLSPNRNCAGRCLPWGERHGGRLDLFGDLSVIVTLIWSVAQADWGLITGFICWLLRCFRASLMQNAYTHTHKLLFPLLVWTLRRSDSLPGALHQLWCIDVHYGVQHCPHKAVRPHTNTWTKVITQPSLNTPAVPV